MTTLLCSDIWKKKYTYSETIKPVDKIAATHIGSQPRSCASPVSGKQDGANDEGRDCLRVLTSRPSAMRKSYNRASPCSKSR